MPYNRTSILLEAVQNLSKSKFIRTGDITSISKEILTIGAHFLKIERANCWLVNLDLTKLDSILSYERSSSIYSVEPSIFFDSIPNYIQRLYKNDIIISLDARNEEFNRELLENYLIPNNIYSMIEVPLFIAGDFKGVICFEQTDHMREWSIDEQHFALALAQLLVQTIENKEKNSYREQLEISIQEKNEILKELNSRVRNYLSTLNSIIKLEASLCQDEYHTKLFSHLVQRNTALSALVHTMYQGDQWIQADFTTYIKQAISLAKENHANFTEIDLQFYLEDVQLPMEKAMPAALITHEIASCFLILGKPSKFQIELRLFQNETAIKMQHVGIPFSKEDMQMSNSYILVEGLTDQIDGEINLQPDEKGSCFLLKFKN